MWGRSELVTIIIKPTALCIQWFEQSQKKRIIPRAWLMKPLDTLQVEDAVIFNLTFLVQTIAEFLKEHGLKNAFVNVGLAQGMVDEALWWRSQKDFTVDDIAEQGLVWNYTHVVSDDDAHKHLFYKFGVAREILFQYQLLALQVPCRILCITSKKRALLHAISSLQQTSLSPTLFSDDLMNFSSCCTTVLDLFGYETIFEAPPSFKDFFEEEKEVVGAALGLFLLGKDNGF